MKAYLRELVEEVANPLVGIHLVREYLQARILQSLQRADGMRTLAFHGGTSLRFLYDIPRYSEDLDFALEANRDAYDLRVLLQQIVKDFEAEAYSVDVKLNDKRVVHKAFVRFRGLLHELQLSGHKTETIAIKIEVDTNPPAGAVLTSTALQKFVPLNLNHHDSTTLLAGKLHAIFNRPYVKGRDWFDLWWYLKQADWPLPNLTHLNNSLQQSGSILPEITADNWQTHVVQRIEPLDWSEVMHDVEPFIIEVDKLIPFDKETLIHLLNH